MQKPIPWLPLDNPDVPFPDVATAMTEPDGLLAGGGDLSPQRLLRAYRHGIFPWYSQGQPILWWCPSQRAILLPDQLHISRSMHKLLRKQPFQITFNQAFAEVINACAEPRKQTSDTWITQEMREAYIRLYHLGHARSVECWQNKQLVGGVYGVQLGQVFFGESMFSRVSNASKAALITITQRTDVKLVDCQLPNQHLRSMGMLEIPRTEFITLLERWC